MRIDLPILNNNALRGRGALINPVNRFSNEVRNVEPLYWEDEDEDFNRIKTRYIDTKVKLQACTYHVVRKYRLLSAN